MNRVVCMYVCMYVCLYAGVTRDVEQLDGRYVNVNRVVRMCVCMYVCMYVCMQVLPEMFDSWMAGMSM